jgi:hypothetical protein
MQHATAHRFAHQLAGITAAIWALWLSADANGAFVVFHERAAWDAAVSDLETIDFTGFPDNTVITDQYANQCVVFPPRRHGL